ncbi:putative membrane protein YccC [Arthrobacter silviterrae]|uniref:FUSC family protein n=1 Tax=Arthrobacter silviterrae TaxID=2026658 RepID=A0ABX0DAS7_9MICC|nr:FUSC family protein [Arthrobacter silviterrae]MDQ0277215.1 putative membrane protein YccC [Arthrobacter silviterrae]NGN83768.1 FUSC family protein [Arthrobacter silviterrae]
MPTLTRVRDSHAALAHAVSPGAWRRSFAMRPADAIFAPAIKVGIAASLVLVSGGLLGQGQLAGIASLGALVSAFGRYQPYPRLGRILVLVAGCLLLAAGAGSLMGAAGVPPWYQIAVFSVLAGLAAHVFGAFGVTGPGAVILVFAASAGSGYAHTADAVPRVLAAVALGAGAGWIVAMAPVLVEPMGPARLAVARAIAAVVQLGTDDAGTRLGDAASPLRRARESVALSAGRQRSGELRAVRLQREAASLHGLLDEAEAALSLAGEARAAALGRLARHESALRRTWRTAPTPGTTAGGPAVGAPAAGAGAARPAPEGFLAAARAGLGSWASAGWAVRMAAASALAGWAAVGLGLGHPLWASMGAVAALQGLDYSTTVQRSIQRLLGNVAGAALAVALLSVPLGFWPSVALVVAFQVLAELLVLKNYTLTTIAVTPMALLMTGLGSHLGPEAAFSRVADTLAGVVAGVLVAAVSISRTDRAHVAPEG